MSKTQDQIWCEMESDLPIETKERRAEYRKDLLDLMVASCTSWEKMGSTERSEWMEEQKALINAYFPLRDKLVPRMFGNEILYGEEIKSKKDLSNVLSNLESITREIESRISLEVLDADELERWRELDLFREVEYSRNRLRRLSRLPQSDSRIDELLYLYRKWDEKSRKLQSRLSPRMSGWNLFITALFDSNALISEQNRIAEAAKAEGMKAGIMHALWAFDYAPDQVDLTSDSGRPVPLAQLGKAFWRSGDFTP